MMRPAASKQQQKYLPYAKRVLCRMHKTLFQCIVHHHTCKCWVASNARDIPAPVTDPASAGTTHTYCEMDTLGSELCVTLKDAAFSKICDSAFPEKREQSVNGTVTPSASQAHLEHLHLKP
mmetsp:Transcript_49980/g.99261  ORF Transcript_49980/g.99261 Transcript_49980/m.99261 type:complete len:121 (+) Transcript_49980:35-397(+)